MRSLFVVLCLFFLSACGQALDEVQWDVPATIETQRTDTATDDSTSLIPTAPLPTETPTPPAATLPEGARGTFDPNTPSTLKIGGRSYTLGSCVEYHCNIILQPDNTSVWVLREVIGLEKWTPPPITVFVRFTPVPKPPCQTVAGAAGSVTVCGWGDLTERLRRAYTEKFGGSIGSGDMHPTPQPFQ